MADPLQQMRVRRQLPNHTFGPVRKNPDGTPRNHQGWDLAAPPGTPVYAVADGTVESIADDAGDYGRTITLRFLRGGMFLFAFYAHLSYISVAGGQQVSAGQLIGYTGNTGNAAGLQPADAHLHFELRTAPVAGLGLGNRLDPGELLGYEYLSSQ